MTFTRAVFDHHSTALGYHRRLPARIRTYLMETRGLSGEVIDEHFLGWNGLLHHEPPAADPTERRAAGRSARMPPDALE